MCIYKFQRSELNKFIVRGKNGGEYALGESPCIVCTEQVRHVHYYITVEFCQK